MLAVPSILIAAILSVAGRAHVFGVMFAVYMGALCYFHHLFGLVLVLDERSVGGDGELVCGGFFGGGIYIQLSFFYR